MIRSARLCLIAAIITLVLVACAGWRDPAATDVPPVTPAPKSDSVKPDLTESDSAGTSASPLPPIPSPAVASSAEPSRPLPTAATPATPVAPATSPSDPFDLISQESMLASLEDLTAIQPYSGWRTSASAGEAEALDYVAQRLGAFEHLQRLGLEMERESFHVFLSTELWETRLHLTVGGQEIEVPADGLRGPRDDIAQARRFDSDGSLNDASRNPAIVQGAAVLIRSADEIHALSPSDLQGKVVFLDYATIDRTIMEAREAVSLASELVDKGPAGLVLVTHYSNQQGESHGSFVGDGNALYWVETDVLPPTLYVRLEDLAPAGIAGWDDLERIETARLTWDADVFAPGESGNLVACIPGADDTRAMILGAHIDSPNAPGALDDGSGSAILLEVARVLDASRAQPPTDLCLVWFGSEELGLYGSAHFVTTHQELLDRTAAMLQIDALGSPLDGLQFELKLVTWPYSRLGDSRLLWPDYLAQAAGLRGVDVVTDGVYYVYSDNSSFGGFDVPHADLIYEPPSDYSGSIHYASHWHDPYDDVKLARGMGDMLEKMARVALVAAVDTGLEQTTLRVTPHADRRALFVASHTEAVHMTPVGFTELGMTLAMEGFDVDLLPYGQAVTHDDLEGVDLVVVLPVVDYPSPEDDPGLYDEAWDQQEIDALEAYVAEGGLLVLTNSAHRLKYGNQVLDPNEDWSDANDLASRFGVTFVQGNLLYDQAQTGSPHPLVERVKTLSLNQGNGVPFRLAEEIRSQALALAGTQVVVALVDYGQAGGQVLVLADMGPLAAGRTELQNLPFWQNLARYAR